RIWDEKLKDEEQAIVELQAGWPHSAQATECARVMFGLYARTGRHLAAQTQIDDMVAQCPDTKKYVRSAEVLAELVSGKYPSVEVRTRAGGALQQVVSHRLAVADRPEANQLVAALSKLAPQDRLLERDGRRFVAGNEKPAKRSSSYQLAVHEIHRFDIGLAG